MNKLVLFDIDGTLIKNLNAIHLEAFSYAFKEIFGVNTTITKIDLGGKTDKQIIIETLKLEFLEEKIIREKMEEITNKMIEFFNKESEGAQIELEKGVKDLLSELVLNNTLIGLVTGNLERIARRKMEITGLNDYFKFGGFGSDAEKRSDLVKIAKEKAENISGHRFSLEDIFLVGDTLGDIAAGKEVGVKTIGIATGKYSVKELKEANPDFVFNDLSYKKDLLDILLN